MASNLKDEFSNNVFGDEIQEFLVTITSQVVCSMTIFFCS